MSPSSENMYRPFLTVSRASFRRFAHILESLKMWGSVRPNAGGLSHEVKQKGRELTSPRTLRDSAELLQRVPPTHQQ